jgi:hypothetical protein
MTSTPQTPSEQLTGDKIAVTIPGDEGFEDVAQLVLGGVAARLNLTYESLDDLGTALATLLERRSDASELTIELEVGDDVIVACVGPFPGDGVVAELERPDEGVGLRRVLETVVDSFGATVRDGGQWVELQKRVTKAEPAR